MKLKIKGVNLRVDYYFVAVITLLLVVFQKESVAYSFLFCAIHEIGHLTAMLLLKEKPCGVELGYFGMKISYAEKIIPIASDLIISAAGPALNIILAIFFGLCGSTEFSGMNSALAVFNLLPVPMLDGGRILSRFVSYKALRATGIVTGCLLTALGILTAVATRSNFVVLIVSLYVLLGTIK